MADEPLTPAVFALLLALSEEQRHGYALISEVAELTNGLIQLGPGTLYRSLQRMRRYLKFHDGANYAMTGPASAVRTTGPPGRTAASALRAWR